jgi:manganese/zinc/iron transport system substrate-binding protein
MRYNEGLKKEFQQMYKIALWVIAISLLTACSSNGQSADNGQLNVVATTGQIADAVANVAGDHVNLTGLLGPGVDPHLYVPTEGDVSTFSEADVIFYNGLHLEAQMTRVMAQMEQNGITVVAVGDELPDDRLLGWTGSGGAYDPHIWNDPALWSMVVATIRDTLATADPGNAADYQANAERYLAEISDADSYVREQIDSIPAENRIMITAHDAFGYFARSYGLEVRGLQGISTESEASTADVQALADYIVEKQVPAIFVETSVSPRTIESVQAAVRAQGFEVQIGGSLFSDALGEAGHEAETYTGMLRYNARTLAEALGD